MKKKDVINYGPKNAYDVGLILKDIVRRASEEVWKRRVGFVGTAKQNARKPNEMDDLVTDADFASQELIVRKLDECFPGYGIIAEEKGLKRKCTLRGEKLFFTIDPLDGTKAFGRRQSNGFGPMLSLCTEEEVIASYVADTMSRELYYYRPESHKVHRLNFGDAKYESLLIDRSRLLIDQYVLLRDDPRSMPGIIQHATSCGIFKNIEVIGGGIGTWMARLWKGEVGACVLDKGVQTPWDFCPIYGITKKLGCVFLQPSTTSPIGWALVEYRPTMENVTWDKPTIILHGSRVQEFVESIN